MSEIKVETLTEADARELSELLAAYVTEMKRGAPRKRDLYYVETLLADPRAEFLGAKLDGGLVGYALFYDLPEVATGRGRGALDDLFVDVHHRRKGVARALMLAMRAIGGRRGWDEIRWSVPQGSQAGGGFSRGEGEPSREETFRILLKADAPLEQT